MLRRVLLALSGMGGPLPPAFASHSSIAAGSYSTTTSFADYLTAAITTTTGTNLLIVADLSAYGSTSDFIVEITVDGVSLAETSVSNDGAGWGLTSHIQVVAPVSAGALHTVKARVKSSSGSHTLGVTYHSALTVKEF